MKTINRIEQYITIKGYNLSEFERICKLSNGYISKQIKRNASVGESILKQIIENCPDISPEWLYFGTGEMLKPLEQTNSAEEPSVSYGKQKIDIETRPRIPLNAMAGALSFAFDGGTINDCEQLPVIRAFPRYDFTILINGESMEPELRGGDELACLNVNNTSYIQGGRIYVLDTDQGIVVKRVHDNGDSIICHSDNKMFSDYIIPKPSVYNIALVVGMLRRY